MIRVDRGRIHMIRRARGYAPLPVVVASDLPRVLAVGAHQKSTIAIAIGRQVFLSQHLGDLDTLASRQAFEQAIAGLCCLYDFAPDVIACDLHPDYASTQWARAQGKPVLGSRGATTGWSPRVRGILAGTGQTGQGGVRTGSG